MYARSGLVEVSPSRVDDAVRALADEQIPRYRELQGYRGITVLADRHSGKILGISFWESEADIAASDALGEEARTRVRDAGGGSGEPVREVWEVLLDDPV